jgi:glycosidase
MAPETIDSKGQRHDPDDTNFDNQIHAYYRAALQFRAQNKVLADGRQHDLYVNDADDTFAFLRTNDTQKILVAFNRSEEEKQIPIPLEDFKTTFQTATPTLTSNPITPPPPPEIKNETLHITLPPLTATAFELK